MSNFRLAGTLGLALLAFAANSVICRLALSKGAIDAGTFTAIRIASGALLLALLIRKPVRPTVKGWLSASMLFAYAACFSFAYLQLTAATGALLLFGSVQVTMLLGALGRGERPRAREWLGWVIAFAGLVYLVIPGLESPPLLGASLMICAGVAWGIYSLLGKSNTDPIRATGLNFLLAVPMAAALFFATGSRIDGSANGILLAVLSGAVTSALGYVLWYSALRNVSSISAAIAQLSVPVIAAIGGIIILSEPLSTRLLVSTIVTLGGVAIALFSKSRTAFTASR